MTGSPARTEDRGVSRLLLAAAALYVAVIFFVSSRPYLQTPGPDFDMKDKLAHLLEYAILGGLLGRLSGRTAARSPAVAVLLVVAVAAGVAAADEVFQGTVPGRMRDVGDWVADVIGAALGGAIAVRFGRGRARAEDPVR